jgi:DNA-binding FadR family transcriptional regulator
LHEYDRKEEMSVEPRVNLRPVRRERSLQKTAQEEIKNYILANALEEGDSLPPESALADRLGISRTVVREAVKALEAVGIVEVRPGAGLFVQRFTFDRLIDHSIYGIQFYAKQLSDVLDVRHLIELGMAPKVIAARTAEQIDQVGRILAEMRTAAERGEYSHVLDEQFHRVLHGNTNNAFLLRMLDIFWEIYREAHARVVLLRPPSPMTTYQRHQNIFQALVDGDAEAMTAAMMRHRVGVEDRVRLMEEAQEMVGK